jgi:hypothetical protein
LCDAPVVHFGKGQYELKLIRRFWVFDQCWFLYSQLSGRQRNLQFSNNHECQPNSFYAGGELYFSYSDTGEYGRLLLRQGFN